MPQALASSRLRRSSHDTCRRVRRCAPPTFHEPSTNLRPSFHQPSTNLPRSFHQPSTNLPATECAVLARRAQGGPRLVRAVGRARVARHQAQAAARCGRRRRSARAALPVHFLDTSYTLPTHFVYLPSHFLYTTSTLPTHVFLHTSSPRYNESAGAPAWPARPMPARTACMTYRDVLKRPKVEPS